MMMYAVPFSSKLSNTRTMPSSPWNFARRFASSTNFFMPSRNCSLRTPLNTVICVCPGARVENSPGRYSLMATLCSRRASQPMYVTPNPPYPRTRPIR